MIHNDSGPAVAWRDGYEIYAINGLRLDKQIVMNPESQTIKQVDGESNNDIRMIRMERFGIARYLQETGAKVVEDGANDIEGTHEALIEDHRGQRYMWPTCPSGKPCPPLRIPREVATIEQARNWLAGEKPFRVVART